MGEKVGIERRPNPPVRVGNAVKDSRGKESGAVAQICRVLEGMPLAIELAAAWVRVLSIEQISERLDYYRGHRAGSEARRVRNSRNSDLCEKQLFG